MYGVLQKVAQTTTHCVCVMIAIPPYDILPKLSLANNLFRGVLPKEFRDITWIEEMVCTIYCNSAHVTRLYQSSDPTQLRVFHGITCAHEMNVISTATVLPRTPSDINDSLSMVFIGPGKFKAGDLGGLFHIHKHKILHFLK